MGERSKPKVLRRQPGLANDGAGGADGKFFLRIRHDGDASGGVLVFSVAALPRSKKRNRAPEALG